MFYLEPMCMAGSKALGLPIAQNVKGFLAYGSVSASPGSVSKIKVSQDGFNIYFSTEWCN